jgi:hypothetical protein
VLPDILAGAALVQLIIAPATLLVAVKFKAVPLQMVISGAPPGKFVITGIGSTVISTSTGKPRQELGAGPFGVITYVIVMGAVVPFTKLSVIWKVPAGSAGTSIPSVAGPIPSGSGQLSKVPVGVFNGSSRIS